MMVYCLINASCFILEITKTPGWRPSFTFFTWWTALLGAILCFGIIFSLPPYYSFIALVLMLSLYKYIDMRDPDVNWGSSLDARHHSDALKSLMKMRKVQEHVKNFRPSYLVLTGDPAKRKHLVYFGNVLRKAAHSLCVYGHVTIGSYKQNIQKYRDDHLGGYLQSGTSAFPDKQPKVKGFFNAVLATSFRNGVQMLVQLSGLGNLKPNVVVFGMKQDWQVFRETEKDRKKVVEFVRVIRDCFRMSMGVMVTAGLERFDWKAPSAYGPKPGDQKTPTPQDGEVREGIDVWWLIDDGGLTVLIPTC
eukprot:TRINITY_DN1624_c0_g1_i1.p1 TRINITY_DN1624_c0_g1~~TRINITY_DN1624_c0_g1_i1.p1  ORF type:complete len:305 (+),score=65.43 TRINITY_DN1624_c0_g1_i1:192-1106(+)